MGNRLPQITSETKHFSPFMLSHATLFLYERLFPLMREFGENVQQCTPHLHFFFFLVEISSGTLIPLFRPGSVHSGPAISDHCDQVLPDKLCVS